MQKKKLPDIAQALLSRYNDTDAGDAPPFKSGMEFHDTDGMLIVTQSRWDRNRHEPHDILFLTM